MRKITLNDLIKEQLDTDPEFADYYQKELLINAIAKMVHKLRSEAGLTQAELAQRANTTQPVIARLESGADTRMPSLTLLAKVATASNARLNINFEIIRSS